MIAAIVFGLGACCEFYGTFLDDIYNKKDDWDDDAYLIEMEEERKWFVSNYKMDFIGMHFYLLSGVIQLIAQRNSYRRGFNIKRFFSDTWRSCSGTRDDAHEDDNNNARPESTNPTRSSNRFAHFLIFLGTAFFLCGIIIDCTIAYISDPALRHKLDPSKKVFYTLNQVSLSAWDLTSSILWNIDAILYICADILLYSIHKKDSKGRNWLCKKSADCGCTNDDESDAEIEDAEECTDNVNETQHLDFSEHRREDSGLGSLLAVSLRGCC